MKTCVLVCALLLLSTSSCSQTGTTEGIPDELARERLVLLSDLRSLALEVKKIDGPLARALAGAEIADAVWTLDSDWAKRLLNEAYQLTFPTKEELSKFPPAAIGAAQRPPTEADRARTAVRTRIFSIAQRDKDFANRLAREGSDYLDRHDQQAINSNLARDALDQGHDEDAIRLIEQTIGADPTQLAFTELVNDLATKNRAAADKLILQCIASLRTIQLSGRDAGRSYFSLMWLVFPNSIFLDPNKPIPNPGPEVMKAYVSYIIESLSRLEQQDPGSIKFNRSVLLSAWLPLRAYAPELASPFMQLEALSRTPGKDASLPTQSYEEADRERFRKRDNDALNSNEPNDLSIASAIARENFDTARKLISKLPDSSRKTKFTEQVNTKEAISLAKKGNLLDAQNLAGRLTRADSILQVYPLIVQRYAARKDQIGASAAVHQAIRQIRNADTKATTQFDRPPEFVLNAQEFDPVLSSLSKLAKAVLAVDSLLASEVVDEFVGVANRSELDTKQGRTGFDTDVFNKLAAKDEVRARSAAENFKDLLRRLVALAAIYQWKAKELQKPLKTNL